VAVSTASKNVSARWVRRRNFKTLNHTSLVLKQKALLTSAFCVWVLCFYACPAAAQCAWSPAPNVAEVKVLAVFDGDTVLLTDQRRVRLIGLNAPEVAHKERPAEAFGDAATKSLITAIGGKPIYLRVGSDATDHYGRTLGYLWNAHYELLAETVIREGLAYHIELQPDAEFDACLNAAEQQARAGRLGIWSQAVAPQAVMMIDSGGFHLLRTRITAISESRQDYWLSAEGDLTLKIKKTDLRYFSEPLDVYLHQPVEVRGWVIDRWQWKDAKKQYQRWMLPIRHPSALVRVSAVAEQQAFGNR
jgi:endonuclease YncB( thermonuclease family)